MGRYWEIFAEPDGALIVERHGGGWQFDPTTLGRPRRKAPAKAPRPQPSSPLELLPPHIDVERLAVV